MSTDVKPSVAFGAGLPNSLNGFSLRQGHQLSSENQTGREGHENPQSKPSLSSDIILVKVVETCGACPSQWDGWDAELRYYYMRYRFGHGTVHQEAGTDSTTWRYDSSSMVASFEYGDRLSGVIELDEFCSLAGIRMSDDCVVIAMNYDDYDDGA